MDSQSPYPAITTIPTGIGRFDEISRSGLPRGNVATAMEPVPVAGRRGRILVVDDEEILLRSLKRTLGKDHDVVAVTAAKEALALCLGGETFDLILCDLMMPEMTGVDLHGELSRVVPEQASRMIFLTGGAFTAKARLFLSEPPREHIDKPFDVANLRAIVRRFLR
jgi:CheY-like chemotaxis protein